MSLGAQVLGYVRVVAAVQDSHNTNPPSSKVLTTVFPCAVEDARSVRRVVLFSQFIFLYKLTAPLSQTMKQVSLLG